MNNDYKNYPNPFFYPIPTEYIEKIKRPQSNFSLCFNRHVNWEEYKETNKKRKKITQELCGYANQHILFSKSELKNIQERQKNYLKEMESSGLQTIELYAKTTSPFITGLGSGHPTETGMILDRNTGVPYLPASSIKGVLRLAHAVNIANGRSAIPNNELDSYFGSTDDSTPQKGSIIFLDAYPIVPPVIKTDILNPHFSQYYEGKNQSPIEKEEPNPIQFLSVELNTVFCFRCVLSKPLSEKDKQIICEAFQTAFSAIGFGGKTSIGYGRFKSMTENEANTPSTKVTQNIPTSAISAKSAPQNSEEYLVRLLEQNKKGTWKAEMCDFPTYIGAITNSPSIREKKAGDTVKIKLLAAKEGNSIFQFIE